VEKFVSHSHFLNSTILCATTEMQTGVALEDDLKDVLDEYSTVWRLRTSCAYRSSPCPAS
jgi:hypothetical protein